MKFLLVFDNSGDELPFTVVQNHELFEFFVDATNSLGQNSFSNNQTLYRKLDQNLTHLHWALSKTNEVMFDISGVSFKQSSDLENYLDQKFLNMTHCEWVISQKHKINIDTLRYSNVASRARLGNVLHELCSDNDRVEYVATILEKLGYLYPYEEINQGVHQIEHTFNTSNLEFKADKKWDVIDNPFLDRMVSNNDVVNFSFSYTFVGRQYYDKFVNYDTNLEFHDHYNYEKLELAFHLGLSRPQTIPYSKEFLEWVEMKGLSQSPIKYLLLI